ncbi:MAG: aspartyl/asparaginyl beta-hydroxylase domain-containing protein [Sphingomonas sp.]
MWLNSGAAPAAGDRYPFPDRSILAGAPAADAPLRADPNRPLLLKYGKHLRPMFDRLIAASSLVSTDPVLDVRDFGWSATLRADWRAIRDEALAAVARHPAPSLASISPDHRAIAPVHKWRGFFLWGYGYRIDENRDRCPVTGALVEQVPGLVSAFFSIHAPGTHIPPHRGVTKGLITCHLGLVVPRDGDVRMRIGGRIVRWAEGETLIFDDTCDHEIWNEAGGARIVLSIQFRRPLRQPGRWFADAFLAWLRASPFVQEARANLLRWNAAAKALEG